MAIIANTRSVPFGTAVIRHIGNFFNAAADMVIASYKAKQTRNALSKLSARQLDDIGLSASDIFAVSRRTKLPR